MFPETGHCWLIRCSGLTGPGGGRKPGLDSRLPNRIFLTRTVQLPDGGFVPAGLLVIGGILVSAPIPGLAVSGGVAGGGDTAGGGAAGISGAGVAAVLVLPAPGEAGEDGTRLEFD